MNAKDLQTLEYNKILEKLAAYAAFSMSSDLAMALRPLGDLEGIRVLQLQTTEARRLLSSNADISVGAAHDVRPLADLAGRGGVLESGELIQVKSTLISARTLGRVFEHFKEEYPHLYAVASLMPVAEGLIDSISRVISEQGEVLDQASDKLASIRRELVVSHERLLSRLERLINDTKLAPMLQESLITQRNGRYVVPLRADFKGRLKSIVHDQSSSGATLFVEPLAVVELNNRWQELQLEERDEIRRILTELSNQVGDYAPQIVQIVEILGQLDLAFMRAKYAEDLRAAEPVIHPITPPGDGKNPGVVLRLFQARHPLLDPATVVPLDIDLEKDVYALVITGPNTGGKTVTLKTAGLLALMAQSGLHIPAQSGSEISLFDAIYADIGDEQSIEQSLSTFSGHIKKIVTILKKANQQSLVLLDELGAGTDPQEGASLACAILNFLVKKGITTLIATHYPELKIYAHTTPGVVNASVEFDIRTLKPTYHLTVGLPGRSNALAIASRLGLPEDIVSAARSDLNPNDLRAEDLLDEIHRQRDLARQARSGAEQARQEAMNMRAALAARMEKIEEERLQLLEKASAESEAQLEAFREELQELRRELQRARQPLESVKKIDLEVEKIEKAVQKSAKTAARTVKTQQAPLRVGERVKIRSLKTDGVITELGDSEVEVQVGMMRLRTRQNDIQRAGEVQPEQPTRKMVTTPAQVAEKKGSAMPVSPGGELDLRGQRAEDALDAIDRYLESAYMSGLPFVRIIHGKGTGRLRQVIREYLRSSQYVSNWETGLDSEGGDGVTVARLKSD